MIDLTGLNAVLRSLCVVILYLLHNHVPLGHIGEKRVYDRLSRDDNGAAQLMKSTPLVSKCQSISAQSMGTCHEEHLHLCTTAGSHEVVDMDVLDPFSELRYFSQHVMFLQTTT